MSLASYPEYSPIVLPSRLITSLEDFCAWVHSHDFPQNGRVVYIQGRVEIDTSPERSESHTKLKTRIATVLDSLTGQENLGHFYGDGARLSNSAAELSCEPDAMFFSHEALQMGRIHPESTPTIDSLGFVGTPDWVLEIVSPSSRKKDKTDLRQAYYDAGIPEYWIVDALKHEIEFTILVRGESEYHSTAVSEDGWTQSSVFRRWFKLTRARDQAGLSQYTLATRE